MSDREGAAKHGGVDANAPRAIDILLPTLPPSHVELLIEPTARAKEVLKQCLEHLEPSHQDGGTAVPWWRGLKAEGWSLREVRSQDEGKWWSEVEVKTYRDREYFATCRQGTRR